VSAPPLIDLTGRVAVVTGAGAGIGAATASVLARCGAAVVATDIDGERAEATCRRVGEAGGSAISITADAGDADAWDVVRDAAHDAFGPVAIVVNNAYLLRIGAASDIDTDTWNRQIAVTLTSVFHSVRTFADDLRGTGGAIVNVSSVHARLAFPGHPAYAACKGAMISLSQQLAVDLGPDVRVNAVLPGPILTPQWDVLSDEYKDHAARSTALVRLGRADEVANAIAFLASDAASYVTGSTLLVDGGYTVRKDPA
jgi:NAD(P)-dependent dehydrogenase (short-subunit alcohol dehydrogenase family)